MQRRREPPDDAARDASPDAARRSAAARRSGQAKLRLIDSLDLPQDPTPQDQAAQNPTSAETDPPDTGGIPDFSAAGRARRADAKSSVERRKSNRRTEKRGKRRSPQDSVPVGTTPVVQFDGEGTDPLQHEDLAEIAIKSAPAWLVSLLVHTALLLVLGLLYVAHEAPNIITLNATYAEQIGDQLDDDTLASDAMDPTDIEQPVFSVDVNPANDPLASPPDLARDLQGMLATDTFEAPSIGIALTGREAGMKKALLAAYGGTATTEAAVGRALEWLKRNQRRDGLWSLTGPYSQAATDENRVAATAMALLAFQGAGHTHDVGKYHEEVFKGWRALLKMQDRDGNFYRQGPADHQLYSQAQVMIALCEIYGMTKNSMFKRPAQKAVDYAVEIQAPEGGWRYRPRKDSDTSVTGWFVMGLQSALMAGLDVPSPTLQRVSKYLDSVADYGGAYYKYQPNRGGHSVSMTAEGLLCRQYLGWKHDDPRLQEGVAYLLDNPIDWGDTNTYYWYYATQVMHHMEGDAWDRWNRVLRDSVPKQQVMTGAERGSWSPDGDRWGNFGGRLYQTCLCTFMLEVYYRHLPIYSYRLD